MTSAPPSTDPLRDAEDRLDADALATLLIATPEAGRRARATELQERIDEVLRATERSQQTAAHHHTAQIAWFGTGLARDLRWSNYRFGGFGPHPRLAELLAARPRNVMTGIVRSLLVHDAHVYWPVVRRLVEDGRFPRPEAAEYLVGMVRNLGAMSWKRSQEATLADALLEQFADPRIVEELWEAFELEVVVDQITVTGTGWQEALVAAVQRGLIDRDRMLDVAVDGQLRDLRPSSAAFFRRVAEGLDPTDDELTERQERLVRIVAGAHPAEQRAAAAALRRLRSRGRPVDGASVAAAVTTPLTGRQKAAAIEAVRLLDAVDLDVATRGRAAAVGLGHPHADVQGAVLDVLERDAATQPLPADVQEELLIWLHAVAPEHRARVEALTGVEDPAVDAVRSTADVDALARHIHSLPPQVVAELSLEEALGRARDGILPAPASFPPGAVPPLTTTVAAVVDGDELAELLTVLMVGTGDAVDLERAIDGLARTSPTALTRPAHSSLARLTEGTPDVWPSGALQENLSRAVAHWLDGRAPARPGYLRENRTLIGTPALRHDLAPLRRVGAMEGWNTAFDGDGAPAGLHGFVTARLYEAVLVGTTRPRPTLALPERSDGTITAAVLADRLAAFPARESPGRFEAVQALLRVPGGDRAEVRPTRAAAAVAGALRAVGGQDVRVADEGLARAVTTPAVAPTRLLHVRVPGRLGPRASVGVVRLDVTAPSPRRRDDPAGLLLHQLRVPEGPIDASGWWNPHASPIPPTDRLLARSLALLLPRHRQLVELTVASGLAETLDDNRSTDSLEHVVGGLVDADVPLGWSGHLLLAVALCARNEAVGAAGSDVVASAGTDGRLDAALLGRTLVELDDAGVARPGRFAARLEPLSGDTVLLAEQVRRCLRSWLAAIDQLPRDAHAVLAVLDRACERSGTGIEDGPARSRLESSATGTSKRARSAARLLGLPTSTRTPAAADLLEGLVRRAERWAAGR